MESEKLIDVMRELIEGLRVKIDILEKRRYDLLKLFIHTIAESILNDAYDLVVMLHPQNYIAYLLNRLLIRILLKLIYNSHYMSHGSTKPHLVLYRVQQVNQPDQKCYVGTTISHKVNQVGFRFALHADT